MAAKQKAISAARGEWILQLDADEEISPELKREIRSIIEGSIPNFFDSSGSPSRAAYAGQTSQVAKKLVSSPSKPVAYWLPRKNYFLGRFLMKGGVYPDYTIRLYRRGVAHFPCRSVHENVEIDAKPYTLNPNPLIGYLKNPLLHYADPTFARYMKRWRRYNDLDAMELHRNVKCQMSNVKCWFIAIEFIFIKPVVTFLSMYVRHKGFMDSWQGFVFAFFSSIRYPFIYIKSLRKT